MTNKLISLALLIFFLTTSYSYSEYQFIFPKKKPSVFKKIDTKIASENLSNLPQKKPIIQTEGQGNEKLKEKKAENKKKETVEKKSIIKKVEKSNQKKIIFLLPQKKPITYKVQSKEIKKSTALNQKDFEKAK